MAGPAIALTDRHLKSSSASPSATAGSHPAFVERCRRAGQTRTTPILLRYAEGGFNGFHRDVHGTLAFPLQLAVTLGPGAGSGGDLLLLDERPGRRRVRAISTEPGDGGSSARAIGGAHRWAVREAAGAPRGGHRDRERGSRWGSRSTSTRDSYRCPLGGADVRWSAAVRSHSPTSRRRAGMKLILPALAALAGLALAGVLAVLPHAGAPVPVAERWPSPEVVATAVPQPEAPRAEASAAAIEPAPPVEAPSPVGATAKAPAAPRPGIATGPFPRVTEHLLGMDQHVSERRCPPTAESADPKRLPSGRCPPVRECPLVLSFDGGPVEYLADDAHGFDVNGDASVVTDWPTARTPWLALDRDGNGRIGDGSELFGSMTVLSSGERASDGFAALRELDADGDGHIAPADPGFSRLLVWTDRDGDRRSTPDGLVPASAFGLLSIDLDDTIEPYCDARGNCEVARAAFRYLDAAGVERTGAIVDVRLAVQR